MPGAQAWGYYPTTGVWLPIQVDSTGKIIADMSAVNLDDLADVSVPSPSDQDFFYYDDATKLWKSRALLDADIPATIARDSEVTAAVAAEAAARAAADSAEAAARAAADAAHALLYNSIHGLPASYSGGAGQPLKVASGETSLELGTAGYVFKPFATQKIIWWFLALGDTARTATVSSVSGDTITLTANVANQFFDDAMEGNVYLKIKNTTRTEYAWVMAYVDADEIQVTDADDISGWQNGDSIQGYADSAPASALYQGIDLTPCVGSNADLVFVYMFVKDTASASFLQAFGEAGNIACVTQAANLYNVATGLLTFYSSYSGRQITMRASAADTALECCALALGYLEEL